MENNLEFQVFRKGVQQVLVHLYDPDFSVPLALTTLMREEAGLFTSLRSRIINEIDALKSEPDAPPTSRGYRSYRILTLRFVDGLSQEITAEKLQMSLRSLQRAQRQAVLMLAYQLWNRCASQRTKETDAKPSAVWQSQLDQEITILKQQSTGARSEIHTILKVINRINCARTPHRFDLQIPEVNPNIATPFQAPVLQQIILSILDTIMERAPRDTLAIQMTSVNDQSLSLFIIGGVSVDERALEFPLVDSLLAMQPGCHLSIANHNPLTVILTIPQCPKEGKLLNILFVDDNADLADLFNSYCVGAPYTLHHIEQGMAIHQKIRELTPDLIILDVMLPDVDGWELLIDLKANPETAIIPVIVCSVVTDAHLAIDLGASQYLQKPVWRQQWLDAVRTSIKG